MVATKEEFFFNTMNHMNYGEALLIVGGTFPGPNQAAEIKLAMDGIIPVVRHLSDSPKDHPIRFNPFVGEENPIGLTLTRNDKKFGHDAGALLGIGKQAGQILGLTVDLVTAGYNQFYFVGKASQ